MPSTSHRRMPIRCTPWGALGVVLLLCVGCGSEEEAVVLAWQTYHKATMDGDVAQVRDLLATGLGDELQGPEGRAAFELRSALVPARPVVQHVAVDASRAIVQVSGALDEQPITGRITFARESTGWRVLDESWNIDLSATLPSPDAATPVARPRPDVDLSQVYRQGDPAMPQARSGVEAHEGAVTDLAFTPNGALLVSISYDDHQICLWDVTNVEFLDQIDTEERPSDLAMMPDGSAAYVVDASGRITRWPITPTGFGDPQPLAGKAGRSPRLAIDAAGRTAVTTSWDEPAKLWDLTTGRWVRNLPDSEKMRGVSFSPVDAKVACGSHADFFAVWNLERLSWPVGSRKKHTVPKVSEQSEVASVAYSPDGRRLATGHMDTSISIWDMEKGKQMGNWYIRDASVMDVEFSRCGTVLATAQHDGNVYVWETESQRRLFRLAAHEGAALSLAFNPADGVSFASGGEDGTIWFWQ